MKLISRRHSLGLLCLFPAGCAGLGGEPPLEILLSNLRPGTGGGLGEAPLDFIIRIENTSPEPLTVDGGSYKIYLNDTYIGQGLSNTPVTLPRLGSQTITATVHVSTFRLMGSLYSIFKSHQVSYRLQGTIYASRNGGGSHSYKVSREGTVNLDELQGMLTK
ncbi:MAG: LEA type 2 family protein [Verrucomicrobiota bacterium]